MYITVLTVLHVWFSDNMKGLLHVKIFGSSISNLQQQPVQCTEHVKLYKGRIKTRSFKRKQNREKCQISVNEAVEPKELWSVVWKITRKIKKALKSSSAGPPWSEQRCSSITVASLAESARLGIWLGCTCCRRKEERKREEGQDRGKTDYLHIEW